VSVKGAVHILVLALLTLNTLNTQPTAAQTKVSTPALLCSLGTNKDKARHEKGPKVGARVRELRKHNKNVDRALAAFERNGKKPRIDESESITIDSVEGTAAVKEKSPFRNVSYKPQDPSGYGLEVTVITTYEAPGEWQGTVIANKFASSISGRFFLDEYVADLVIGPDPTGTAPDVKLEVSYEDGQAYLEYGNESVYQQLGTAGLGFIASKQGGATFSKASFQYQPGRAALLRRIVQNPRVRGYVKCTWTGSFFGGLGCAAGSAAFAGAPFVPCLLIAGTTANSYCAYANFFP
jgi:hypothetical protein